MKGLTRVKRHTLRARSSAIHCDALALPAAETPTLYQFLRPKPRRSLTYCTQAPDALSHPAPKPRTLSHILLVRVEWMRSAVNPQRLWSGARLMNPRTGKR